MENYTLQCVKHPKQQCQLVVSSVQYRGNPAVCWECLLDDSQFVNSNRKTIVPFKEFVRKIADELIKVQDDSKNDKIEELVEQVQTRAEEFQHYIKHKKELIKQGVIDSIDSFSKQIEKVEKELFQLLDLQNENFQKQVEFIQQTYSKRYCLSGIPTEEQIVEDLLRYQDDVQSANDYIKQLKEWLLPAVDLQENSLFIESVQDVKDKLLISQSKQKIDIHQIHEVYNKQMSSTLDNLRSMFIDNLVALQKPELINLHSSFNNRGGSSSKNDYKDKNNSSILSLSKAHPVSSVKIQFASAQQIDTFPTCLAQVSNQLTAVGTKNGLVEIFNRTGQAINTLANHKDQVTSLLLLKVQNKEVLVSSGGNLDPVINLWDLQSFKCIGTLKGHQSGITCLTDVGDGQSLISGSYDNHAIIWNPITMKPVCALRKHQALISSIKVFDHFVATGSWDKTISIWNLNYQSGTLVAGCKYLKEIKDDFPIITLEILDNNVVYGGTNKWIKVYSLVTDQIVHQFQCSNFGVFALINIKNNHIVGLSQNDQTLRIWREGEQQEVAQIKDSNLAVAGLNSNPLIIHHNNELIVLSVKDQKSQISRFTINFESDF